MHSAHTHTQHNTHARTHAYSIGQVRVIDPNCDEIAPKEHFASSPVVLLFCSAATAPTAGRQQAATQC